MATPILQEVSGSAVAPMIADLAGLPIDAEFQARLTEINGTRPERELSVYAASAGFELTPELEYLASRAIENNIFYHPRFLAPAMPRLEDREVRLAVMRDNASGRLRLLVPFSVERSTVPLSPAIMRVWSGPFGPNGTPLIDHDDPVGVLDDFLAITSRAHLGLPPVIVIPDIQSDGAVANLIRAVAINRNLPLTMAQPWQRPFLQSTQDGETYLRNSLKAHHYRGFARQKRRLEETGNLEYRVDRNPDDIRAAFEEFLMLEASGWKGRSRTAMAIDRFRAAFAREAVNDLAELDLARMHSLALDGRTVASVVVFIQAGTAFTWKTAYAEDLAQYSPGTLLMIEVTKQHLDDPNIVATDSCAVPDHPVMSRLWTERRDIGTIIIGLTPGSDRAVRQTAAELHLYSQGRNALRKLRDRVLRTIGHS